MKNTNQPYIVVIDNHEVLLNKLLESLSRNSFCSIGFTDGVEAIDYIRDNQSSLKLIITGLDMPFSGFDLVEYVRRFNFHISIILITGSMNQDLLTKIEHDHAIVILHKPFTTTKFLESIKNVIGTQ